MNKILIVIAATFLLGCNSHNSQHNDVKTESAEKVHDIQLQLNNGKKWQIDSLTRKNITVIKELLSDSSVIQNEKNLVSNLQEQVDLLVNECKMTGADHLALHQWLEVFLKDLKELKEPEQEPESLSVLQKDLVQFDFYFE